MNAQKALETITNAIQSDNMTAPQDKALAIAQKALEKQIPKKPDLDDGVYCPCCLHEFKSHYDETRYCPNCGQAIDWGDSK